MSIFFIRIQSMYQLAKYNHLVRNHGLLKMKRAQKHILNCGLYAYNIPSSFIILKEALRFFFLHSFFSLVESMHEKGLNKRYRTGTSKCPNYRLMQTLEPNRSMQITGRLWAHSYNQWSTSDRCCNHRLLPAKHFQTKIFHFHFLLKFLHSTFLVIVFFCRLIPQVIQIFSCDTFQYVYVHVYIL